MTKTGGSMRRHGALRRSYRAFQMRSGELTSTSRAVSTAWIVAAPMRRWTAGLVPVLDGDAVGASQLDQLRTRLDPLGLHDWGAWLAWRQARPSEVAAARPDGGGGGGEPIRGGHRVCP